MEQQEKGNYHQEQDSGASRVAGVKRGRSEDDSGIVDTVAVAEEQFNSFRFDLDSIKSEDGSSWFLNVSLSTSNKRRKTPWSHIGTNYNKHNNNTTSYKSKKSARSHLSSKTKKQHSGLQRRLKQQPRIELAPTPILPRYAQEVISQVNRMFSNRTSFTIPTKSPFYASYRQPIYEPSCQCTNAQHPHTYPTNIPTIALTTSEQASEQARAFFNSLPAEIASQLATMIADFSSKAPPGSRVVLVVRPLPTNPQHAGRRKYQLQLRYVREDEPFNLFEPSTFEQSSQKASSQQSQPTLTKSSDNTPKLAHQGSKDVPITFEEKYLFFRQSDIAIHLNQKTGITITAAKQKLNKGYKALTKRKNRWPQRVIKNIVTTLQTYVEQTAAPRWQSNSSLQFAIFRIELLRYLTQLKSILHSTNPIVTEEEMNTCWSLFLLISQKTSLFVTTFSNASCPEAVTIVNNVKTSWERLCALLPTANIEKAAASSPAKAPLASRTTTTTSIAANQSSSIYSSIETTENASSETFFNATEAETPNNHYVSTKT